MNKYRFHWLSGDISEASGKTPAEAFTHLGYGNGALRALDYWEEVDKAAHCDVTVK